MSGKADSHSKIVLAVVGIVVVVALVVILLNIQIPTKTRTGLATVITEITRDIHYSTKVGIFRKQLWCDASSTYTVIADPDPACHIWFKILAAFQIVVATPKGCDDACAKAAKDEACTRLKEKLGNDLSSLKTICKAECEKFEKTTSTGEKEKECPIHLTTDPPTEPKSEDCVTLTTTKNGKTVTTGALQMCSASIWCYCASSQEEAQTEADKVKKEGGTQEYQSTTNYYIISDGTTTTIATG